MFDWLKIKEANFLLFKQKLLKFIFADGFYFALLDKYHVEVPIFL
jgi:hypothetical protein